MGVRNLQVRLIGEGRCASDHRLVDVEVKEIDYIRINGTTKVIDSRSLADLFLDMPHRDFTKPSRFERTLFRSLSGVMDFNRDYFLDVVIPETVSFAYNTGFRKIKMVIELLNLKKTIYDGDACTICLEKLSPSTLVVMSCLHVFHEHCASRWLKKSSSCPLCRKECNRISYLGFKL